MTTPGPAHNMRGTDGDETSPRVRGRLTLRVLPHAFGPVVVVAVLVAALLLAYPGFKRENYPPKAGPATALRPNAGSTDPLTLKDLFDERLKQYRSNIDQFYSNLQFQALFTFLCLLLVLSRSSSLQVFGNTVPLRWLHLLIPAVMLYLWLSFGFLLDDLIKDRISGAEMIDQLAPDNAELAKGLLRDSRFVDGWILTFVDPPRPPTASGAYYGIYSGIDHNAQAGTALFLLCLLGTWMAAAHAATLATVAVGARRYLRTSKLNLVTPYYLLPLIPFAFFTISHYQFAYSGHNRNNLQPIIAIVAVVFYMALIWLSVVVDRARAPSTLLSLKRHRKTQTGNGLAGGKSVALRLVLLGDSLSTEFHVAGWHEIAYRLWFSWRRNWFNGDAAGAPPIDGVLDRVSKKGAEITAYNRASATGSVALPKGRTLMDWVSNTFHFGHQVDELIGEPFPDILLLWIGHNNVDWVSLGPIDRARQIPEQFVAAYEIQLRRLIGMANESRRAVTIIVFGLVNFRAFFEARDKAELAHSSSGRLFPLAPRAYRFFKSMRPEYRQIMITVADRCNEHLSELCYRVQPLLADAVRVIYSQAMSDAPIKSSSMLHGVDAWHPSREGHQVLADSAWSAIEPELRRFFRISEKV